MRAKFGGDPTARSQNLPFKFNNRLRRCRGFGALCNKVIAFVRKSGGWQEHDSKEQQFCITSLRRYRSTLTGNCGRAYSGQRLTQSQAMDH